MIIISCCCWHDRKFHGQTRANAAFKAAVIVQLTQKDHAGEFDNNRLHNIAKMAFNLDYHAPKPLNKMARRNT